MFNEKEIFLSAPTALKGFLFSAKSSTETSPTLKIAKSAATRFRFTCKWSKEKLCLFRSSGPIEVGQSE
jgi:hypothetical protein